MKYTYSNYLVDEKFRDVFYDNEYIGMIEAESTGIIDLLNEQLKEINDLKEGKWQCRLCGYTGEFKNIVRRYYEK